MKRSPWLFALLGLGLCLGEVSAQLIVVPNPYGLNTISGGGLTYTRSRRNSFLSIGVGSYSFGTYGYGFYPAYRQVTVIYSPPVFLPPPIILGAGPPVLGDPLALEGLPFEALARMRAGADGLIPLPLGRELNPQPRAAPPEPRRVPPPERRAPAPEPLPPPPKPPEPRPEPKPAPPPKPAPKPPQPPAPEKDPLDENARLLELGRKAFANQEYGKASQRFRQAVTVAPHLSQAHFLLAQSLFALAKYPEAVEAIHAGMALQPDWPNARFKPLDLYGANLADYPEQLRRLEETVERHPNDAVLLFLYAHQLWFDGRRDEARLLLLRALPGAADPRVIQRFLRALPGAPVV